MPDDTIPPETPNGGNGSALAGTPLYAANEKITKINVADEIKNSFLDYSMSVIISRALPDVRDGLKPSQRRILYAMHELSLFPGRKHYKCAKICGDTSGNYHPHGEAVIYPTLVHMAQPWAMRERLVDGKGNFGSVENDPPAAMRYTEARLTHLGAALMQDMDKDTVDFVPNYDERMTEPTVFPAAFPNLLVNGGTGIAVGMATNMAPHNLGEVIDGICAQIDKPEITIPELMKFIKGPDFPTGGMICGIEGIKNYFHTGRGSVKLARQDRRGADEGRARAARHHRDSVQRESRGAGTTDRRSGEREDHHRRLGHAQRVGRELPARHRAQARRHCPRWSSTTSISTRSWR